MVAALVLGLSALAPAAYAAAPADTVAALTRIDLANGTGRDSAAAATAITGDVLPSAMCGPAQGGSGTASRPVPLVIYMPLPPQCDEKGEVVGLLLDLGTVTPAALSSISAAMAAAFGNPASPGRCRKAAATRRP